MNNCVISLRHKGMPKNITEYHEPWIYEDDKMVKKGCLHIRI
jgi:hypothetical protein